MNSTMDWDIAKQTMIVLVTFAATFLALYTIKKMIFRRLLKWARNGKPHWYQSVLDVIQKPLNLTVISISLGVALQAAPEVISQHIAVRTASKLLLIISIFWLLDRAVAMAIRAGGMGAKLTEATRALLLSISHVVTLVLGAMIALDTLGISITPLLASLGIGSVAIALALQDTLSNFFGGVYVLIDKPIRVGDMVRIEDGTEGVVRRIGWRSSHIEVGGTNTVVIPNTKLASSIVTNYDLPTSEVNFTLPMGVAYECDLNHVEKITLAVTREILKRVPGGVPEFEPQIRFTGFGDSSVNFNLILRAQRFSDMILLKHELIKAIHSKYNQENIEIPFPQRTIRMYQPSTAQSSRPSATPS